MAFKALKPHAHAFIFTSRLLGSHLFKHLKNTLRSPAREKTEAGRANKGAAVEQMYRSSRRAGEQKKWRIRFYVDVVEEQTDEHWWWYCWRHVGCVCSQPAGFTFEELINFLLFVRASHTCGLAESSLFLASCLRTVQCSSNTMRNSGRDTQELCSVISHFTFSHSELHSS